MSTYGYTYTYNTEHERVKLITARPDDTLTTVYLHPAGKGSLLYEKETRWSDGRVEHKHYVNGGAGPVGLYVTYSAGTSPGMRYYHRDHLGSVAAISNEAGAVVERLAYEAFGERRSASGTPQDRSSPIIGVTTDRGFTGHEHLDELNLIHMNGRIYDPALGRFMTADPFVQDINNLQSYNRYTYGWNNPMVGTDPSGYLFGIDDFFIAVAVITAAKETGIINKQTANMLYGIATALVLGPEGGFGTFAGGGLGQAAVAGFAGGFVSSGGTLEGGVQGAFTASLFYGAGFVGKEDSFGRFAAHAAAGCVSSAASGGGCGSGALSAGLAQLSSGLTKNWSFQAQLVAKTVVGGTASVLGGGKFSNGALTAAFGHLFNDGFSEHKDSKDSFPSVLGEHFMSGQARDNMLDFAKDYGVGIAAIPIAGPLVGGAIRGVSLLVEGRLAASLAEQIVMRDAQAGGGKVIDALIGRIGDPRFSGGNWVKMQVNQTTSAGQNITVHYMKNIRTGETAQFKFINPPHLGPR